MTFDFAKQEQEFEQLKDELDRMNNQLDAMMKEQGVTLADLQAMDLDNPPPELKEQLEAAKAAIKRAGEERKGRAQTAASAKSGAQPGHRAGAIRL
jgi:ElaB/YqjD/DUF883 family membrane-anchored ribosome-binding protein